MSDQAQEKSVSLHSQDEASQQSKPASEPVVPKDQADAIVTPHGEASENQHTLPGHQVVEGTTQRALNPSQYQDAAPFASEFYGTQQRGVASKPEPVYWTASEYIAHKKGLNWYLALGAIVVVLTVLIFFITGGDVFSSVCILILAIIFGVYAGRQPQEQEYVIDEKGVSIGKHTYTFDTLKSFSVIDEGAFSSIVFMPMKRFMPLISIYYDPADEDRIIAYLSSIMPMEYRKRDSIDRLMHKIKF